MKLLAGMSLCLLASVAYADQPIPPAFHTDPSKPVPQLQISPDQANTAPTSPQTQHAWQNYDSPLRNCVKGDTVLPSNGNDLFSVLFHNNANIDITMSIQGWKQKECFVNFSEAANTVYCRFNPSELQSLMKVILNSTQFLPTDPFAQTLNSNCSPTPPVSTN